MVQRPNQFGEELRRRRLAAGLTITRLAVLVHYSKGQLSKVERGIKMPSPELARLCDAALAADGALIRLADERPARAGSTVAKNGDEEAWLMRLFGEGLGEFQPLSRRQVVVAGAASIPSISLRKPATTRSIGDSTLLGVFRTIFDEYRRLGQAGASSQLLPALVAQIRTLQELSRNAGQHTRQALLVLASRYAEYVGWLVQETGNEQAALRWTRHAVALADAGGDQNLAAYGLVRHALITLYHGDANRTIQLAWQAQSGGAPTRIQGLAAQREAQGHALAGDYDACMRALEHSRVLLARHVPDAATPIIGPSNLPDPAEMIRGWCLYDLGRPRAAAEVLDQQLPQIPREAVRTRVRFGVRRALAHAAAGEVDHACQLSGALLDDAITIGSATVATDLRKLARTLSRHPRNASMRCLAPKLGTALRAAD